MGVGGTAVGDGTGISFGHCMYSAHAGNAAHASEREDWLHRRVQEKVIVFVYACGYVIMS
jgi:hypothetical protein